MRTKDLNGYYGHGIRNTEQEQILLELVLTG